MVTKTTMLGEIFRFETFHLCVVFMTVLILSQIDATLSILIFILVMKFFTINYRLMFVYKKMLM